MTTTGPGQRTALVLGVLAALTFAALIPLTVLSREPGNGVIAAVIGLPCAAVGTVVARRQQENSRLALPGRRRRPVRQYRRRGLRPARLPPGLSPSAGPGRPGRR